MKACTRLNEVFDGRKVGRKRGGELSGTSDGPDDLNSSELTNSYEAPNN